MKHLNNYDKFNEGILDHVRKLGPGDRKNTKDLFLGRAIDDIAAKKIFQEMKDDFEKFGKYCGKMMIINDYKISYVFGEFNIINNNPMTGNKPKDNNQKKIGVSFFKNNGLEPNKGRIEIETITPNPNYDPEFRLPFDQQLTDDERKKLRMINRDEEEYKISYDVAKKIYDYFDGEFIKQYPQLKNGKYKNQWSIQTIEKGEEPSLGSVDLFDPNHLEIIYSYTKLEDKEKLEKYIKSNPCFKGRNKDRQPITYFSEPGESDDAIRDNMMNFTQEEVDKQNMERVYKFNK